MAMLAEKKRREKWCLNPRGNSWSDDKNKFGQQLLEKMGWSPGQGLGVNNQGPTECVKVKKKDDSKGLGFKDNGEEWLKTTSEFNELLSELKSGEDSKNDEDQLEVSSSLEDRSKKSKARLHYHKFTRGKDLSRYSEKDLASIIGPDVLKQKNGEDSSGNYTSNQVVKGSSTEYFNSKKESNKTKSLQDSSCEGVKSVDNEESNNDDESNVKPKKRKKKRKSVDENKNQDEQLDDVVEDSSTKNKNHKNCQIHSENTVSEVQDTGLEVDMIQETVTKKKKKRNQVVSIDRNQKTNDVDSSECSNEAVEETNKKLDDVSNKKKNKKENKKQRNNSADKESKSEDIVIAGNVEKTIITECITEKKISKKRKRTDDDYTLETDVQDKLSTEIAENVEEDLHVSKKKKKKKVDKEYTLDTDVLGKLSSETTEKVEDDLDITKKKKKKKVAMEYTLDVQSKASLESTENIGDDLNIPRKKKKKLDEEYNNNMLKTNVQSTPSIDSTEHIEEEFNIQKKKKKIKVVDEGVLSVEAKEDEEETSVKIPKSERRIKKEKLMEEELNISKSPAEKSEEQPLKFTKKCKKEKSYESAIPMETGDAADIIKKVTNEHSSINETNSYVKKKKKKQKCEKQ